MSKDKQQKQAEALVKALMDIENTETVQIGLAMLDPCKLATLSVLVSDMVANNVHALVHGNDPNAHEELH